MIGLKLMYPAMSYFLSLVYMNALVTYVISMNLILVL